jgi:hypothetical protein
MVHDFFLAATPHLPALPHADVADPSLRSPERFPKLKHGIVRRSDTHAPTTPTPKPTPQPTTHPKDQKTKKHLRHHTL